MLTCMSNGKGIIRRSVIILKKKIFLYKMSQYFPELYESFGRNAKFEWDLSNYATKVDLKRATSTDTSNLASKHDVPKLKAEVDKLDFEKLKAALTDLTKPSMEQIMILLKKLSIINYSRRLALLILE